MRPAAGRRRRCLLDPEDLLQRRDPTSSCSGVGSLVAQWRWISRPGVWKASARGSPWWRSLQANISTAIEAPPRPTPARAAALGLSTSRSSRTVPPAESSIIGTIRLEPQRSCSFGHRGDVVDPALVGGDRLVLDAVVGGEVAVASADQRRHRPDRLHDPLAQRRRPAPACAAARWRRASPRPRRAPAGPRTAAAPTGRRRRASGSTAIASASFIGPRRPGTFATRPGSQLRLALGGDFDPAVAVADRRRPVGRAVDQQPVAEGHAAEAELLRLVRSHAPTIGDRPLAGKRRRAPSPVHSTPSFPLFATDPAGGPQSRPPAGLSALPGFSLGSRL